MSYEVVFHFHERMDNGYDKEVSKELKKRIGKNYEEVSLGQLSSFILSQLARRDIFIYDYEVYEYKKQKLNCKETKDGIVIKGKKFTFDGSAVDFEVEVEEDADTEDLEEVAPKKIQPHNLLKKKQSNLRKRKPLKHVMVDPDVFILSRLRGSGLRFSPNKEYAVYGEKPGMSLGILEYLMVDDLEREGYFTSEYFVPSRPIYDKDVSSDKDKFDSKSGLDSSGPRLTFEDEYKENAPDIRRRY